MTRVASLLIVVSGLMACGDPGVPDDIFAPLGEPVAFATPVQRAQFDRGREVALRRFAPDEGLGPHFNVTFCGACHEKPVFGGGGARYRNFLLVGQRFEDGSYTPTGINGVQPQFTVAEGGYVPSDDSTNTFAQRNPIPFFGVGLLAEISEEEILSRVDPDDADGDGISGRANFERGFVGRFGRKSQSVSIESFIRGPLFNHLGITSDPLSNTARNQLPVPSGIAETDPAAAGNGSPQVGAPDEPTTDTDPVADPELSEQELFDLVAFTMLMAAPEPDPVTDDSKAGKALFKTIGCDGCHVESLRSPRGLIPAYTDLLIHDMGDDLADNIPMGDASGSEFRTAPLWGVTATSPYLHDGRADTLDEAIRWHGGEAADAADAYVALEDSERQQVLTFLRSLGGGDQRSEGLLPPNIGIPATGTIGAPLESADGEDLAAFVAGRTVFDRDFSIAGGMGPRFNGDACRACHFDPVIGGAGPNDVNVTRHAVIIDDAFTAPAIGTMAHRHLTSDGRPPVDPAANYFEQRQTPAIFGLGLVDRIPEATILSLEDPSDLNADGISGRAHVLGDGRVGRLGWKADVPSLAEFARDAMSAELGLTLPDQAGLSFGAATDDDDAADPEIGAQELEDLTAYMSYLAPPPRTRVNEALEDAGESVFSTIGCDSCHIPSLMTEDMVPVGLYSDLLLHDVAPTYRYGIESGDASMTEFRTSPLWGISHTAPYMHDGSAMTIEAAILQHGGEADDVRAAFLELPSADRGALLAFLRSL